MRYSVRRVAPASALRAGCALGWIVMLPPALCVAGLLVRVVQAADESLRGLRDAQVDLPDFELPLVGVIELGTVPVDLTGPLGLDERTRQVGELATQLPQIFAGATLAVVTAGALAFALVVLLVSLGYNLLAGLGFGIEVDLAPDEPRDAGRDRV
jgi:hypothetical protein